MASSHSQIIIKEQVDGWNVPVRLLNAQLLEFLVFILYSIFLQCFVHVHRSAQSLPDVAPSMGIHLQISLEYFLDGLLAWHLQNILVVCQHIDQFYSSALMSQPTDDHRLIFPPLDFQFLRLEVQISASWSIECSFARIQIDACSWLSSSAVEKVCNVSASSLYQWPCLFH